MARLALSVILSCIMASAVAAQDAIPETPPELRDFRLDPERAPPAPQPQPEIQPPAVVRTVEPQPVEPQPVERRPERAAPSQQRQVERQALQASGDPTTAVEKQPEETAESVPAVAEPLPESTEPTSEAAPSPSDLSSMPWWQILAAIATAIMALIGGWLYVQRRRADVFEQGDVQPAAAFEPNPAPTIMPQPVPAKPVAKAGPRPQMSLEFIPDKATLGFNALTLKGRLQLVNNGNAPADDMQLRATMISANKRQKETIVAFHSGALTIAPNALGSAKAGERLGLDIEMSVPVNELESYTVGGKRIFVPLMLASLEYAWADGKDSATIACMIGRETEPPQPKMGPLRLDLGPRSFEPLGQRPVYA